MADMECLVCVQIALHEVSRAVFVLSQASAHPPILTISWFQLRSESEVGPLSSLQTL